MIVTLTPKSTRAAYVRAERQSDDQRTSSCDREQPKRHDDGRRVDAVYHGQQENTGESHR